MAVRSCERCGDAFEATRSTAKYCRPACRKAAEKARVRERAKAAANVVQLGSVKSRQKEHRGGSHTRKQAAALADLAGAQVGEDASFEGSVASAVEVATLAKFDALGVNVEDPQPMVAITLAKRIDRNASETGAGLRALVTAYIETMDLVLGSQKVQADPLDMLREVRKRIAEKALAASG